MLNFILNATNIHLVGKLNVAFASTTTQFIKRNDMQSTTPTIDLFNFPLVPKTASTYLSMNNFENALFDKRKSKKHENE
jgi:hypothetical protein